MRVLGIILLVILLYVYLQIEVSSSNPCNNFSSTPSLCNSDNV